MDTSILVATVQESAERYPERAALIAGEQRLSYSELMRQSQSAALHIAQETAGDNVGIFLPNSLDFTPYFLGGLWAGKTVAVLPTLAPAPLLKFMSAEAGLAAVFTSSDLAPRLAEAGIPHVVIKTDYPTASDFRPRPRDQQAAVLLYSSGTTGRPKAVALSENNLFSNIKGCCEATGFDARPQVMLAVLPLFHAYGLTVTLLLPLVSGSTVVISERFAPRTVLNTIERHHVTCIVSQPISRAGDGIDAVRRQFTVAVHRRRRTPAGNRGARVQRPLWAPGPSRLRRNGTVARGVAEYS